MAELVAAVALLPVVACLELEAGGGRRSLRNLRMSSVCWADEDARLSIRLVSNCFNCHRMSWTSRMCLSSSCRAVTFLFIASSLGEESGGAHGLLTVALAADDWERMRCRASWKVMPSFLFNSTAFWASMKAGHDLLLALWFGLWQLTHFVEQDEDWT